MSRSGTPTAKVTTATALNYTYFTGGGPPSSCNPHGWQSFGNLLRILTAATFFQLRLLQALPRLGYKRRHLVFQIRFPQILRRLGYNKRHLVFEPLLQALPRLGY